MPSIPGSGTSAHVNVNGRQAQEYAVSADDRKVTCFIESAQGNNFEICFNTLHSPVAYSVTVKLDGEEQVRLVELHRTLAEVLLRLKGV